MSLFIIISSIAVASYQHTLLKNHRRDAIISLNTAAQALQSCYSVYNRYDAPECPKFDDTPSTQGYYVIRLNESNRSLDGQSFNLQATAVASQSKDHDCHTFILHSSGLQYAYNAMESANPGCWR